MVENRARKIPWPGTAALAVAIALMGWLSLWQDARPPEDNAKIKFYGQRLNEFFAGKERLSHALAAQEQSSSPSSSWPPLASRDGRAVTTWLSPVITRLDQARAIREQRKIRSAVWDFFAAGREGQWAECRRLYSYLARHSYYLSGAQPVFESRVWQPINEAFRAYEQLADGAPEYAIPFARDIMDSIPPGSIYFGDTDSGRFLVTFLSESHRAGEPFFTLTQNSLADGFYLDCLRTMFAGKIKIPTADDHARCFNEYMLDAQRRMEAGALKPGENVKLSDGRLQASGAVAVLEICGKISRGIFDQNPGREFFVQPVYEQEWMNPFLSPYGPLLRLNRQPLSEITDDMVREDRSYWTRHTNHLIGEWLSPETSVEEVVAFVERVFLRRDLRGFNGEANFVRTAKTWKSLPDHVAPNRWISGLRTPTARLYDWRAQHAQTLPERHRMNAEADYAYKQAFAICAYLTETVVGYTSYLADQNRIRDALLIAQTSAKFYPNEKFYRDLVREIAARAERDHWSPR